MLGGGQDCAWGVSVLGVLGSLCRGQGSPWGWALCVGSQDLCIGVRVLFGGQRSLHRGQGFSWGSV